MLPALSLGPRFLAVDKLLGAFLLAVGLVSGILLALVAAVVVLRLLLKRGDLVLDRLATLLVGRLLLADLLLEGLALDIGRLLLADDRQLLDRVSASGAGPGSADGRLGLGQRLGCLLVQLPAYVPGEDIFSDYAYFSSYSDSWVAHAKRYADDNKVDFSKAYTHVLNTPQGAALYAAADRIARA